MKKLLSAAMAAATALTCGVCVSAEQDNGEALKAALTVAKSRVEIPEECSQFSYDLTNYNLRSIFTFCWSNKQGSYDSYYVTVDGDMITAYGHFYESMYDKTDAALAKLSADELYSAAVKALRMLNPSVYGQMRIDESSLDVALNGSNATFFIQRYRNGAPVQNDYGSITVNKDTGELMSFNVNWHPQASFQSKKSVISVEEAEKAYAEMIGLKPQYEVFYDYENDRYDSRLVYVQSDYGEINAFTGKKSDFEADGYTDGDMWDEGVSSVDTADKGNPEPGAGNIDFTEAELGEIAQSLPYGNAEGVKSLLSANKYLTWNNNYEMTWSYLSKQKIGGEEVYIYEASFETNWEGSESDDPIWETADSDISYSYMSISLNAQTGEILNYRCSDNSKGSATEEQAEKFAKKAAKALAGSQFSEYTEYSKNDSYYQPNDDENAPSLFYNGTYSWDRTVNDITVYGDRVSISVNNALKVEYYSKKYSSVEFASPEKMLTPEQVMSKVYETEKPELYYLAKLNKKKTKTVLVYSLASYVYCDAFTGEFIYKYEVREENNLDGISDPAVKNKAEVLAMHGIHLAYGKFSENDPVVSGDFTCALRRLPSDSRRYTLEDEDKTLTRGEAMKMFAQYFCGNTVAELKGIFKSPYADIADDDANAGFYAIAYALGAYSGEKLQPESAFTYGDMIELIYNRLT